MRNIFIEGGVKMDIKETYDLSTEEGIKLMISDFENAIKQDPKNRYIRMLYAYGLNNIGNKEEALEQCKVTLELDPDNVQARKEAAAFMVEIGKCQEAKDQWKEIIKQEADNPNPENHVWLAHVLENLGEYMEAEGQYERAIDLNPDCAKAHYGRGILLIGQCDFKEARKCLKEARRIDPETYGFKKQVGKLINLAKSVREPSDPVK
jgi:tetratricopeptide (TPR) repeat protein